MIVFYRTKQSESLPLSISVCAQQASSRKRAGWPRCPPPHTLTSSMEPVDIFMREDVLKTPRLLFQFWHSWQSTPAALGDKQRAAIVVEMLAAPLRRRSR